MPKCIYFVILVLICCIYRSEALNIERFRLSEPGYVKEKISLVNRSSEILCSLKASAVYVYFENGTSKGPFASILKKLNQCDTSFILLRNQYRTAPFKSIPDNGVLMYLVLMIRNASQQIDLSIVKKKSNSKHRSYFIVIVEDPRNVDPQWLRSAFEKFWHIWVLNAVIMYWKDNDIQIFTYSPFSLKFLVQLDSRLTLREEMFPRKMLNMNGRNLTICLYPDEVRAIFQPSGKILGADGFMTSFVASRLNATKVIKQPAVSNQLKRFQFNYNTSSELCLNEMINANSEMALNTRFLSTDTFKNLVEHSVVYGRDDLCVLVPKAQASSLFWNLFRSFQIPVWIAVVLMLLITYAFCRALLPLADQLLIQLYSNMLTQPLSEVPAKISVRLFLTCWFSYCLLISGAYKCNLTSNLVFRVSLPDIDNMSGLANSPYDILIYARHQTFIDKYLDSCIPILRRIKQRVIPVADEYLKKKLDENDLSYAYLEKFHVGSFRVNSRKHTHNGHPLFHLMKTCPIPFQSVYITPYGSPYMGFLDTLVRRAHEHGFVEYWTKFMDTQFKQSGKSVVRNRQNDDDPVVLRFAHLQAAFYLLALGLALATGILIWEIYRVYGIRTFLYNRQLWNTDSLNSIGNTLIRR